MYPQKILSFLQTRKDVANWLKMPLGRITYVVHALDEKSKYRKFEIPKRRSGVRVISAPVVPLKKIQKNLSDALYSFVPINKVAHGFVKKKNIVTNAAQHKKQRYVLNIDLLNFFDHINFGRVLGLLKAAPFSVGEEAAVLLSQIVIHDNCLPQGAPTSPIFSNMICSRMDADLQKLAKSERCIYTRYGDDISFSTSLRVFPESLFDIDKKNVSLVLKGVVEKNGFEINENKVRLQINTGVQSVTGLIVNEFPNLPRTYIRNTRSMLHCWYKMGYEKAEEKYHSDYQNKCRARHKNRARLSSYIRGRIEYIGLVKGKKYTYYKLLSRYLELIHGKVPESILNNVITKGRLPVIKTEGKTDRKHLKAALNYFKNNEEFQTVNIVIEENTYFNDFGKDNLERFCVYGSQSVKTVPYICIFDNDDKSLSRRVMPGDGCKFKMWNNNVYSFVLPTPDTRDFDSICIEHLYSDEDITRENSEGRRLYFAEEFDEQGILISDSSVKCENKKYKSGGKNIIDCGVMKDGNSIAQTKDDFAENILQQREEYKDVDFSGFRNVFKIIEDILELVRA